MAEFSDEIIKIITKKDKTIQTAEQRLFDKLDPTNQRVFAAVKKLVNEMNVSGGKIEFDDTNIDIVSQVDRTIIDAIQSSSMPSAIAEFLRDFETIKKFNFDIHKDVNDLSQSELEDLISPVQRTAVQTTLDGLTGSGVNANFVEPVRQGLFQNIAAGTTKSDLEQYLTNYILGNPNVDGLYSRYVKQVSRDALNQFDGQVNSRIAEEFDLDAFRYVGSLIDDSRSQCIRWVKKRILQKSELDSEISWASNNGSGMIAGTNSENFAVFRGGYNCRHSAIPFKLTPSQKKRLEQGGEEKQVETEVKIDDQINEVKNQVQSNQKQIQKQIDRDKVDEQFFISNQTPEINKEFVEVVSDADGAAKISTEYKTSIGLLTPTEGRSPTKTKGLSEKPNISGVWLPQMGNTTGGSCYKNNKGVSVKIKKGQTIIRRSYDKDLELFENDFDSFISKYNLKKGNVRGGQEVLADSNNFVVFYKDSKTGKYIPQTIAAVTELIDNNIAPTITHEFAHLIHNKVDAGSRKILNDLRRSKGITLSDAPSEYGKTNDSEIWTECFSAFVYAPKWFERNYKKSFDLFEDLLKEYGIDRDTIIQYQ